MQGTSSPKYLTQYAIREERLSDYSRRMSFHTEDGGGEMTLLQAYRGVHIWSIDYHTAELNIQPLKSYHFLKLNYCLAGGCEVQLPQDRYVYVNEGRLSVDTNPPIGTMTFPSGKYVGLEIAIDLREMETQSPQAWRECGVDILAVAEQLSETQGSYLARATPELEQQARSLYEHVKADDLTLGDYRFLLLRFLWLLKTG